MKEKDIYKKIQKTLDIWIPQKMKYAQTPGISIGISHKGKTFYEKSFGYSNILTKKKLQKDDLFRVASMSKMFTSISIMQLVHQEKLNLESPVSNILPEFDTKEIKEVTVRNLLSHQGGVFRDSNKNYWSKNSFPKKVLADVGIKTKTTNPLTNFKYSNFGFSILGKIIEKVSGQKYEDYVEENIIKKLNLKNTYPDFSSEIESKLAYGHSRFVPTEKRKVFKHSQTHEYMPATGFVSNTDDLLIFLHDISSDKSKIIPKYLFKEMTHPYSDVGGGDDKYGLGFEIIKIKGKKVIGHGGGYSGFITMALTIPEEELSVVVLTNTLEGPAFGVAASILNMFDTFKQNKKKQKDLSIYEGVYKNDWGEVCVIDAGDSLVTFGPDQRIILGDKHTTLEPTKDRHLFKIKTPFLFGSPDEEVEFKKIKNKKSTVLSFAGHEHKRIK